MGVAQAIAIVKIDSVVVNAGTNVTVNITAINVTDLANFVINVTYDPSVAIVVDAKNNPAFGQEVNNLEHASEGWVKLGTFNTGPGVSGDVVLSTLTFKAVGNPGEFTYLNLTVEEFFDSNENDIPYTVENGTLIIRDIIPPVITFVSPTPSNNVAINQKYVIINVTSNEPLSQATIHIEIQNKTGRFILELPMKKKTDTNWWINFTPSTDVIMNYRVEGSDLSGNNNSTDIRSLKISGYPPIIDVDVPAKIIQNVPANITITIYDATPSTYKVLKNGTVVKQGTYDVLQSIEVPIDTSKSRIWNYTIWANDSFGNFNQTSILLKVQKLLPLPGLTRPPKDLNGDGVLDDFNGNGRLDFDDLVEFYWHMDWMKQNYPISMVDQNGDGNLDFNDVVELFKRI